MCAKFEMVKDVRGKSYMNEVPIKFSKGSVLHINGIGVTAGWSLNTKHIHLCTCVHVQRIRIKIALL